MKYLFDLLFYDGPIVVAYENDDGTITILDWYNRLGHCYKFNTTQELLLKHLTDSEFLFRSLICSTISVVMYDDAGDEEFLYNIPLWAIDNEYNFIYGNYTNVMSVPTNDPLLNEWVERKKNELL